jgi:glycosyltransferase involved in cell wall biosynthesis
VSEIKDPSARLLCIGLNPIIETKSLRGQIKKNLASLGYYTYNWKVKKLMDSDSRIKNIPATYMITHIMQQCFCNLSYFTIPHANLAMAEAEILGLPTVAALNEEALEYSLNGKNAVLFEANNNSEFVRAIETMQINYQRYKDVLRDSHSVIAEMFSKQKNTLLLNQVISRVAQR